MPRAVWDPLPPLERRGDSTMAAASAEPKPWEQMSGESGAAYAAFLTYRELGPTRSFVGAARVVGRHESLLRRWATRYRWRERAWLWDLHQARQEETVVRQQREAVLRERLEDLDRMGRACLAFFRTMVRRDPETGEVNFDARFTPQVALRFLELALRAQGAFDRPAAEEKSDERSTTDLFGLADGELEELINLARERADQQDQRKDNGNESDQGSTRQEQHEEQEGREQDEARRD
jgi:hypothetical protein